MAGPRRVADHHRPDHKRGVDRACRADERVADAIVGGVPLHCLVNIVVVVVVVVVAVVVLIMP